MKKETVIQELTDLAMQNGAYKCTAMPVSDVVTSAEFRKMCEANSCGVYNKCWTCPPDCGEIDVLIKELRQFENAFLYQTVTEIEDSFDFEGMQDAKKNHNRLSQALNGSLPKLLPQKHLHITAGGCGVCEVCAKRDGEPCRFPEKALASLEAYGVDVYQTVKKTELKYINGQNTVTYFGAVFF